MLIILKKKKTLMKNYRFKIMKSYIHYLFAFILILFSCGSNQKPSPPVLVQSKIGNSEIVIKYNSPRVRDRVVWGELVPYDKIWRTGANEATIFSVNKDILLNNNNLPKGEYSLFTIPGKDNWTVIFNSVSKQWGSYDYESEQDALRFDVKPSKSENFIENMTFSIIDDNIIFNWENLTFNLKVKEL